MKIHPETIDAGYSPPISIILKVNDETFNVAAMGPHRITLRNPRPMAPGRGTVTLTVDGHPIIHHVDLFAGISPDQEEQACRILESSPAMSA